MDDSNLSSPLKKESVLWLPMNIGSKFRQNLEFFKQNHSSTESLENNNIENCIAELLNSASQKHLHVMKKISRNITDFTSSHLWSLLVEIIINGLYYCHSNHLIKSSINGVVRHLSDRDLDLVSPFLQETLKASTKDEISAVNAVELVAAFLQSDFGCKVIVSNIHDIIDFFSTTLNHLSSQLQLSKPTTETAKLYANIHSLSRTLLSILKLIQDNLSKEKNQQLLSSIITVLNLKGIPLDAQGNCSKILIVLTKFQGNNELMNVVAKITQKDSGSLTNLENSIHIRLNLSIALLSSLEFEELLEDRPPHGSLLGNVILPVLLNSSDGLNETGLALLTARLMEHWQRKCFECFTAHHLPIDHSLAGEWRAASDRLLEMSLNGLEHQIDVVRHTAKEAFLLNLKINILLQDDVDRIVRTILEMQRFKKSKYMALACLAKTDLVPFLLRPEYRLAEELLDVAKDVDLSSQAKEVFNLLMFKNMERSNEWMERWLYPLLSAMENHPNAQSFESSLIEILKLHPEVIHNVESWCQFDQSSRLSVYITALLACRRFGLLSTEVSSSNHDVWNGVIKSNVLEHALEHKDAKLRLNALNVIVEGPKTSQLYSQNEVRWVQQFISSNMDNPNAAFRQQFCSSIKKFLVKLKNGGGGSLISRQDPIVASYRAFVSWLIDKCLTDLGPGSSFSRRFLSLHFLKFVQETIGFESNSDGIGLNGRLGLAAVSSLVDCFFDSYDVNKEVALELLQSKPFLEVIKDSKGGDELMAFYRESSLVLSQSLRSADTLAAGYFFRWLIRHERVEIGHRQVLSKEATIAFDMINPLMRMLKVQLDATRGNLCRLAVDAPVYGLLSSVRLLLNALQYQANEPETDEMWASIIFDVVNVCFEASALTSPIVTCDSPEGFIPDSADQNINAQALLVSGWRTIKEVALLFGQISAWMLQAGFRLIDDQVVLRMGLHLKHLLLETKHRGAFEQVYCGFSQLSYALWKCSKREFNCLPAVWLHDIIRDLKDSQSTVKLCATRRSAGLPFIFQAILSPEVEMGRGELFPDTIKALLDLASEATSEGRIHALNILRNLYRESRLNQVIGPYIARGLMLSITGFEAPDWPERNSSTLLFSTLMTRIFGVPRSKNDFQKKNCLTGRVFFQLYPTLYPFLLERLQSVVVDITSGGIHLHPSLFPMLVLLGRLHPPTCDFSDSAFKLEPFVPLVRQCGSSPVLKTRQLAAQALTPLLTSTAYARMLPEVLDCIANFSSYNTLHGTLLQIRYFVNDLKALPCSETRQKVIEILILKIHHLILLLSNSCYLIRYECALILHTLLSDKILDSAVQQTILQVCLKELECHNLDLHRNPFYPLSCQKLAALAMPCISSSSEIIELLNHPLDEVRLEVMQQLDHLNCLTSGLSTTLESIVSNENSSAECRSQALALSVRFGESAHQLRWTLQCYRDADDDSVRCSALAAVGRVIHSTEDYQLLLEWSSYLLDAMESTTQFRQIVIESIAACPRMLQVDESHQATEEHGSLLCNLWNCLVNCLIDDEDSIRLEAASVVGDIYLGSWKQTQPVVAVEKALDYLVNRIGFFYPTKVITLLSHLLLDEEDHPEGDSLAFEKGDSDAYREPLAHSQLLCRFIERCVEQNSVCSLAMDSMAQELENRWKTLENNDNVIAGLLTSGRRLHIISSVQLFLLTKALRSVHKKIAILHQSIRQHFCQLHQHWITYSIEKLILSV